MSRAQPRRPSAAPQPMPRVTVAGGPLQVAPEGAGASPASRSDEALRALVRALARQAAREHVRSRGLAPAGIGWLLIMGGVVLAALIALIIGR